MGTLFSFRGTLDRLGFTLRVVPAFLLGAFFVAGGPGVVPAVLAGGAAAWVLVAASVRRLRDCGLPWWTLLYALPFAKLGLAAVFLLGALAPSGWRSGWSARARLGDGPFLVVLFALLGKLAKADGRVSRAEIDVVQRFMDGVGLPDDVKRAAIGHFERGKDDPREIATLAREFADAQPDEAVRVMVYRVLVEVAFADGEADGAVRGILARLPDALRIPRTYHRRFVGGDPGRGSEREPGLARCYELLGCTPDASDADVKRAYRAAVRKFHPDTLAAKGLPEELTSFALKQTQALNEAYEIVTRERARARAS